MSERQRYRVAFCVYVDVEAYEGEAGIVAEAACGWPGEWSPPLPPVAVKGVLNGKEVTGSIVRSAVLMSKLL